MTKKSTKKEQLVHPIMNVRSTKYKNESQKEITKSIKENPITIIKGIAGSGKSHIVISEALNAIKRGEYKQLYLIKSMTVVKDQDLGHLPGDVNEKLVGYMFSYNYLIDKIVGTEGVHGRLLNEGITKYMPIAYIRGVTLEDAIVVVDECQNITLDVAKTIMSRIGSNSKMIFLGDTDQIDMKNKQDSALMPLCEMFNDAEYAGVVNMNDSDTVRNPIISDILKRFK